MKFPPFALERFFANFEFSVRFNLSPSDCETLAIHELLAMAGVSTQEFAQLQLGYTETRGSRRLRENIVRLYQGIDIEEILTVTPEEGIFLTFQSLLRHGDNVIIIQPAYQSLLEIPHALGCSVTPWPVREKRGKWNLDIDFLADHLNEKTRMIVINFPHNPSGFLPSRAQLQEIIAVAQKHDICIFSDEMYRQLEFDKKNRLEPVCELYENGISLSGLSKAYGLPGLRIGWIVTKHHPSLEEIARSKDYTTICSSAPSEFLAAAALQCGVKILQRNLAIIQANLHTAAEFFSRQGETCQWLPPLGGSVALPRFGNNLSAEKVSEVLREKKQTLLVPGTLFGMPPEYFRIGLGRRDFSLALTKLEEYLQEK